MMIKYKYGMLSIQPLQGINTCTCVKLDVNKIEESIKNQENN